MLACCELALWSRAAEGFGARRDRARRAGLLGAEGSDALQDHVTLADVNTDPLDEPEKVGAPKTCFMKVVLF